MFRFIECPFRAYYTWSSMGMTLQVTNLGLHIKMDFARIFFIISLYRHNIMLLPLYKTG